MYMHIAGGCITSTAKSVVHQGIDVLFFISFLSDHCGKCLHGKDLKLFGIVESECLYF